VLGDGAIHNGRLRDQVPPWAEPGDLRDDIWLEGAVTGTMTDEDRLLDCAESLFYARGVHAVTMAEIRDESGIALRRIYQLYPTKESLVVGYLNRRDGRWRGALADYVTERLRRDDPANDRAERVRLLFDGLGRWFTEPGFRGCAWLNSFGEMGAASPAVVRAVADHKSRFKAYIVGLVNGDDGLAEAIFLLAEGAMVTAAIDGSRWPAERAGAAAVALLQLGQERRPRPGRP
jgi:AcrR family transcriptional regulator